MALRTAGCSHSVPLVLLLLLLVVASVGARSRRPQAPREHGRREHAPKQNIDAPEAPKLDKESSELQGEWDVAEVVGWMSNDANSDQAEVESWVKQGWTFGSDLIGALLSSENNDAPRATLEAPGGLDTDTSKPKSVVDWDNAEVASWVEQQGWTFGSDLVDGVRKHAVTGRELMHIEKADLKSDFHIASAIDRAKVMAAISALASSRNTDEWDGWWDDEPHGMPEVEKDTERWKSKSVAKWDVADVEGWVSEQGWPFQDEFIQAVRRLDVTGRLLMRSTKSTLETDFNVASAADQELVREALSKLSDFWRYRTLHRQKAHLYFSLIQDCPGATLFAMAMRDNRLLEKSLEMAHDRRSELPRWDMSELQQWLPDWAEAAIARVESAWSSPPTSGRTFWLLIVVAPHALVAWYALCFFNTNFWIAFILFNVAGVNAVEDMRKLYATLKFLVRTAANMREFGAPLDMHMCRALFRDAVFCIMGWRRDETVGSQLARKYGVAIASTLLFPITPWFVTDTLFYLQLAYAICWSFYRPVSRMWLSTRSGRALGLSQFALLAAPFGFGGHSSWDAVLFLVAGLPSFILCAYGLRTIIGRANPRQLRPFLPPERGHRVESPELGIMLTVPHESPLDKSVRVLGAPDLDLEAFRNGIRIIYEDTSGLREEGIDAGGLFLDWFTRVSSQLLDPAEGYLKHVDVGGVPTYHIVTTSNLTNRQVSQELQELLHRHCSAKRRAELTMKYRGREVLLLSRIRASIEMAAGTPSGQDAMQRMKTNLASSDEVYCFFGRLIAVAVNQGLPLGAHICSPLCKVLVSEDDNPQRTEISPDDLRFVDEGRCRFLRQYVDRRDAEAIAALDLTFVSLDECAELKPAGKELAVTLDNAEEYMELLARHELLPPAVGLVRKAFWDALDPRKAKTILQASRRSTSVSSKTLQDALEGQAQINVEHWRARMTPALRRGSRVTVPEAKESVELFWHVMRDIEQSRSSICISDVFFWATSCRRLPAGGFPRDWKGHIEVVANPDGNRLPVAHTCSNAIDLPVYASAQQLKEKLIYAVENGHEFGLA